MTTPRDTEQRVAVVDEIGLLALVSPSYAAAAVQRGDVQRTDRPDVFKLARRVPLRPLSPAEKRALELRRQRDSSKGRAR